MNFPAGRRPTSLVPKALFQLDDALFGMGRPRGVIGPDRWNNKRSAVRIDFSDI